MCDVGGIVGLSTSFDGEAAHLHITPIPPPVRIHYLKALWDDDAAQRTWADKNAGMHARERRWACKAAVPLGG